MLKIRFIKFLFIFTLLFTAIQTSNAEIFEKNGLFIDIPNDMTFVKSELPLVIAQMKFKDKDFPTITITNEDLYNKTQELPQEIEAKLKDTYERLGFEVISSNYLKNQQISAYSSKLFQIEYTYSGILFVSLINIFEFNEKTYYITTINKLDNQTPLRATQDFQEHFLNNISLQKENFNKNTSSNSVKNHENKNVTASNILFICIIVLIATILFKNKKS